MESLTNAATDKEEDQEPQQQQQKVDTVVVLDSLPYIDVVDQQYEQYALNLLEDEIKTMMMCTTSGAEVVGEAAAATQKKITSSDPSSSSRKRSRPDEQVLVDEPTAAATAVTVTVTTDNTTNSNNWSTATTSLVVSPPQNTSDINAWHTAIRTAKIAYELERLRSLNLEIDKDDSTTTIIMDPHQDPSSRNSNNNSNVSAVQRWKQYNDTVLVPQLDELKLLVEHQQDRVHQINYDRQQHQQTIGRQLQILSEQYHGLVQKRYQLTNAIQNLEQEIS